MPSKRHKKITDLFRAACEIAPDARAVFLDQSCASDTKLRAEVEALLAHDQTPHHLIRTAALGDFKQVAEQALADADGVSPDATKAIGHTGAPLSIAIEGYDMVRELQRGGQGVVYQAVQRSTKRKVAIKVLLEGPYASESSKKRFEREIEMVAQLKHPNIIPIFHSGKTSDGHHYYVMDYVRGEPLNLYVRDAKPTLEEALALFGKVCDAVNYAHQKGVIHRDLKPSNILVDVEGEPRLLDFGLAKMVSGPVQTLVSVTGQVVGTLPYMSPEQTRGNPDEIDIRTDVYALGVMLYELLTGHYPYPVVGEMAEVLKHIADTEPTPPSRQWTKDSGITKRTSRALRAGQCPIDDELQTIVLKTLSKERERRYQSAGELARDLDHYSAGEPIDAKRDSGWYVLKKAVSRYRVPVCIAASFVVMLAVGLVWISSLYHEATWLREELIVTLINEQKAEATRLLERSKAESPAYSTGSFSAETPVADTLAKYCDTTLADQPKIQIRLRNELGHMYMDKGHYKTADVQFKLALKYATDVYGAEHTVVAECLHNIGSALECRGRFSEVEQPKAHARYCTERISEAEESYERALTMRTKLLGDRHESVMETAYYLASVYTKRGSREKADPLYHDVLEYRIEVYGESSLEVAHARNILGWFLLSGETRYPEAEVHFRSALQVFQHLPEPERQAVTMHNLGDCLMHNLGDCLLRQKKYDEAERWLTKAYDNRRGASHFIDLRSLAHLKFETRRFSEALEDCERVVEWLSLVSPQGEELLQSRELLEQIQSALNGQDQ